MLKCYFVVATLLNTGTFTAGESPAPVLLKKFDNIAYELTNHFTKEDYMKVYKTFVGYEQDLNDTYPENATLTLQTPRDAGGVYVLIWKIPGHEQHSQAYTGDAFFNGVWNDMSPFKLNKNESLTMSGEDTGETFLVEGDKLIDRLVVDGDNILNHIWKFSDDQVIETLESGDAKATRVWKVHKPVGETTSHAPVPLKQFDNIAYEISTNFTKEDYVKVKHTFGFYDDLWPIDLYGSYPKKSTLTLQTPKDAGGVYVLITYIPEFIDDLLPFTLNITEQNTNYGEHARGTYLVEGDKLMYMLVVGDKTRKTIREFSDDQVIETLESGDAKASRVWKVQKTVNSKQ